MMKVKDQEMPVLIIRDQRLFTIRPEGELEILKIGFFVFVLGTKKSLSKTEWAFCRDD